MSLISAILLRSGRCRWPPKPQSPGLLTNGVFPRFERKMVGCLRPESVETTQMYMHADLRLKEKALARITAPESKPGRYRPDDSLLAFLEGL
jgi:hypothetical protein